MEYLHQLSSDSDYSTDFVSVAAHSPAASNQGQITPPFLSPFSGSVTSEQLPLNQDSQGTPVTQGANLRRSKRLRAQDAPPERLYWKDWTLNKLIKSLPKNGNTIPAEADYVEDSALLEEYFMTSFSDLQTDSEVSKKNPEKPPRKDVASTSECIVVHAKTPLDPPNKHQKSEKDLSKNGPLDVLYCGQRIFRGRNIIHQGPKV
ncbi:UNVERIFIED_CONTAM: hypothetical protein FKN15_008052 [Acipenser sinensis]